MQQMKQTFDHMLQEAEQKRITNEDVLKDQIQHLNTTLKQKEQYLQIVERSPSPMAKQKTPETSNVDEDAELEAMTVAFEALLGPTIDDFDQDGNENVLVTLAPPSVREELWSLLCDHFDKKIIAQKTLHSLKQETEDILKEHNVSDIFELIDGMKKDKMNAEISTSQTELEVNRVKRLMSEVNRKYEFLLNGLADALKKLNILPNETVINPDTINMKELLEFVNGISERLSQGQQCSITLHEAARFLNVDPNVPVEISVPASITEMVNLSNQLMNKLSRLEEEKLNLMENQNSVETFARSQMEELNKKLREAQSISDHSHKQLKQVQNQLEFSLSEKQNEINQLHQAVANANSEKIRMSEAQQQESQIVQSLQSELDQTRERERLLQQKRQQLNAEIDKLNQTISSQNTSIKSLEASLEQLESVLGQLQSEGETETNQLRKIINQHNSTISSLKAELESSKSLKSELELQKSNYSKLEAEVQRRSVYTDEVLGRFETMKQMLHDAVGRVNDDNLIDKRALCRLLIALSENKNTQTAEMIINMLRVQGEDKVHLLNFLSKGTVSKRVQSGWFSSSVAPSPRPRGSSGQNSSLSHMWLQFMKEEATGSPKVADLPKVPFPLPSPDEIPSPTVAPSPNVFK
ncbi:hypothetical protein AKO1_010167 [Acrasis kona]|uniref:GRIP domain-containing protein n=1 Tax=Acrasis kona TaxID=1008807 RepID=A0AAW2ZQG2_9EUKA